MTLEESVLHHRLAVMQRAAALGNVSQACREFMDLPRFRGRPETGGDSLGKE